MSSILKDTLSIGGSKIIIIISGLLQISITAHLLGPEINGIIATLILYPTIFMSIGSIGIRQSTTYCLGKKLFSLEKIKTSITQIWFFSTIFSLLLCFILMYFFNTHKNSQLIILAISPIPFALFNTYNSGIFLGQNNIKSFNQINWLPPVIQVICISILIYFFQIGVQSVLIGILIGHVITSFLLIKKNNFAESLSLKIHWDVIKKLTSLGIIYAVSLLAISLNYKMDIILLEHYSNSFQLGLYSKGVSITEYLWQIPMFLSTVIFSRSATSKDNEKFSQEVIFLLHISLIFVGISSIIIYFLAPIIIEFMFGKTFFGSISVLRYLLPGVFLLTIFKVLNMDLAGRGKPNIALYAMIPALIINIILNIKLIPTLGANGASIASTISYSFSALLFILQYSKYTKIKKRSILNFKSSKKKLRKFIINHKKNIHLK
ncbi:oligosaccharide flippase family protein [Flammeovirga aprica]|uniref:Oligosaccharide flippase family protein n=1 Tax=Flammeovirga aprica JL-4 TaxID=694437 RepID=A0A7X9S0L7_9BACT|nr:polysaccharide biosynthesis C-terminal domain-containing protein [Flammeovirga aprica]NME72225.1 oligosaccharide flippase family protein [Flammeovirga aprica JL-4]